ncbi:MAG: glycosyltransferase [bacterium]|nr:glycosyltransferase [bacterium]
MQEIINEAWFFLQQYLDLHRFLVPLGILGLWRWGVWVFKKVIALRYRPSKQTYWATTSIITPVYNENPQIFKQALYSWISNQPTEIIAVVDSSDQPCIQIMEKIQQEFTNVRLIVTNKPGKRPALADGILAAKGEIVALVDSDTIWSEGVLDNSLAPFKDQKVAGVATYQNVLNPKTIAQKIFDTQLDLRYCDDFPFLAAAGNALVCLSGRTAFYRRDVVLPLLDDLVNETFLGTPVVSGDDKRLTYLVLARGWKLAYQANVHVYTPGMADMGSYLKQRLRWSRNSLRADIRAMIEGWTWHYPALAFFQVDKVFQTFAIIVSPIYFVISLILGLWIPAGIILVWWLVSRSVKMYPHLRRRPQDLKILPIFVLYSFLTAIIKLYAFFTLNTQGWITRWDKSRLPRFRFLREVPAYLATIITVCLFGVGIYYYQQQTYFLPLAQRQQLIAKALAEDMPARFSATQTESTQTVPTADLLVKRYTVTQGDTLYSIAAKFEIDQSDLLAANISRIPNWNNLEPGAVLSVPGKDTHLTLPSNFNYQRIYADPKRITYTATTNTIEIFGRGQIIDLAEISTEVGKEHLEEVSPGVWFLKSNIFLHSGTTLNLDRDQVKWLRMKSDSGGYINILAYNAVLFTNGVQVTSWDEQNNDADKNMQDGRSFILAKDSSRMDLYNSEFAYLGFPRTPDLTASPYGVSWRMSNGKRGTALLTGEVINSDFHNNYFGAYTFGATGITWQDNKFHDNVRYGLDTHDDSNGFLVEGNMAYNNGSHGIIFSKRCVNNVIRNNLSFNNKVHGIMLHEQSSNNIVEDNTASGNGEGGVVMWHSSNNVVRNNKIYDSKLGIRANVGSNNNLLEGNNISGISQYAIYLYDGATNNTIRQNSLVNNNHGIYLKSPNNIVENNVLKYNQTGIYLTGDARENVISQNQIIYSKQYGVYSKISSDQHNFLKDNEFKRNRRDLFAV